METAAELLSIKDNTSVCNFDGEDDNNSYCNHGRMEPMDWSSVITNDNKVTPPPTKSLRNHTLSLNNKK